MTYSATANNQSQRVFKLNIFLVALIVIGGLCIINVLLGRQLIKKNSSSFQLQRTFFILWYGKPDWLSSSASQHGISSDCEFRNCLVLLNITKFNVSDAILFYHKNLAINPPNKLSNQTWVFVSFESPVHTSKFFEDFKWHNKFDWTLTYRTDSEAVAPYSRISHIDKEIWKNYSAIYQRKTKDIAWVVSNCETPSKRELYVKKLKEFVSVDIFGKCGTPCNSSYCLKDISRQYKFYLSFENSLCEDYVTEKFYQLYSDGFDIVPVVRGAPNIQEIMPTNTFVSSSDFKSPADLAYFLKTVGSNESMYTKFLIAKDRYRRKGDIYGIGMCEICKNINLGIKSKHYSDIGQWLSKKKCLTPTDI